MKTNKTKNTILKAMAATLLFSSMALAQTAPTATTGAINPDLQVPPAAYGPEVIAEINRQIEKMKSDVPQASTVHIPDYKFAYQILQSRIAFAITNYLKSLDQINGLMSQFLSDINGMQKDDPYIQAMIPEELQKRVPKLNAEMNGIYSKALQQLYILDDRSLSFAVGGRNGNNQLKSKDGHPIPPALQVCQTSACVKKLTDDIAAFNLFVEQFNQEIDFTNFDERTFLKLGNSGSVPVIAIAMADAAEKLMKGVEANRTYSIAALLGALIKQPAGMAVALASAPAYAFEKAAQFGRKVVGLQYLHVDLQLNPIATYDASDANKALNRGSEAYRMKLPTVVFDQAGREKMEKALKAQTDAALVDLDKKYATLLGLNQPQQGALQGSKSSLYDFAARTEIMPGVFRYGNPSKSSANGSLPLASSGARDFCAAQQMLSGEDFPLAAFGAPVVTAGGIVVTIKSLVCIDPSAPKLAYDSVGTQTTPDGAHVTIIGNPHYLVGGLKVYIQMTTPPQNLCRAFGFSDIFNLNAWKDQRSADKDYTTTVGFYFASVNPDVKIVAAQTTWERHIGTFTAESFWTEIGCK